MNKVIGFALLLGLAACSGASLPSPDPSPGPTGKTTAALEFVSPCSSDSCANQAVPTIGCADGTQVITSCGPDSDGTCHFSVRCDPADGGSGVTSYRPCPDDQCGAIDAKGCPPGTQAEPPTCGSTDNGACRWTLTCVEPPSTEACAAGPDACGPQEALAAICSDGTTATMQCMQKGSTCVWQPSCP